jgi:hypothetical protein
VHPVPIGEYLCKIRAAHTHQNQPYGSFREYRTKRSKVKGYTTSYMTGKP